MERKRGKRTGGLGRRRACDLLPGGFHCDGVKNFDCSLCLCSLMDLGYVPDDYVEVEHPVLPDPEGFSFDE